MGNALVLPSRPLDYGTCVGIPNLFEVPFQILPDCAKERFEAWFDELSLNKNIGLYVRNPWCVATFLGCLCMVNQYCAYPKGDTGRIYEIGPDPGFCGETGNGPRGSFLWCHSNSKQQNEAINKLKAEISSYKSRMKGIAFPSKVTTFYEGLEEEQTYTCTISGTVHNIVPSFLGRS